MSKAIFTHFLPTLVEPGELQGGTAVVVDVLRAATTICHALDAGANAVVPCEEVDEARKLAANLAAENTVLGGERDGTLIDGFDLDNSPAAYTKKTVGGRTVVFTTTNGTKALLRCREAEQILLGTFNNLNAVIDAATRGPWPVHLVCAGTEGKITQEDVLFAGAVAHGLLEGAEEIDLDDDPTNIAMDFYLLNFDEMVLEALRESRGGRNLSRLGLDADIERAAELNRFDFAPVFSVETGRIGMPGEHPA